jgi:hypothetical protein
VAFRQNTNGRHLGVRELQSFVALPDRDAVGFENIRCHRLGLGFDVHDQSWFPAGIGRHQGIELVVDRTLKIVVHLNCSTLIYEFGREARVTMSSRKPRRVWSTCKDSNIGMTIQSFATLELEVDRVAGGCNCSFGT